VAASSQEMVADRQTVESSDGRQVSKVQLGQLVRPAQKKEKIPTSGHSLLLLFTRSLARLRNFIVTALPSDRVDGGGSSVLEMSARDSHFQFLHKHLSSCCRSWSIGVGQQLLVGQAATVAVGEKKGRISS